MVWTDRGKRLVCRSVQAFEHHLIQRIAVDGQGERFTHARIFERIVSRDFTVIDIKGDALITEAGDFRQRQFAVRFDGFHVAGSDAFRQIQVTRA
ncbi:hypothetical protein D3C86_1488870 [compost metagenome]